MLSPPIGEASGRCFRVTNSLGMILFVDPWAFRSRETSQKPISGPVSLRAGICERQRYLKTSIARLRIDLNVAPVLPYNPLHRIET